MIRTMPAPALLTILALAGCSAAPEAAIPGNAATAAAPEAAASAYEPCRDRADGDPAALQRCADAEIARIEKSLPGHEQAERDHRAALAALGDDAIERGVFGAGAAAGVAAADAAVRLSRARASWLAGGPAPTGRAGAAALGEAARTAWEAARVSACGAWHPADCAARYDALLAPYLPEPAPMTDAVSTTATTATAAATGLPLPDCTSVKASALVGGALGDAFYRRYPKSLADPAAVETLALDDSEMANVVGYLACVATLTDGDPVVADNAAALFASPRHGRAAFARLEALAAKGGAEAAGAARFLRQMKAQVAG
ncbi:hypothetical protein [Sphingomonas corticis]|jgi:hypothetical protein|uniref:Lipoprotein n=1 Tax=Sphingomonas corticis TaxID=2722791 RepID=A0ABX1CGM5_9SPHN|nr:hypothetical protein [Sphingomonas corticis]NJR77166.1 hypothetical protein [Sphingomonas corticis]